ncbi:MAG: hypothetical protein NTX63_00855 [Candidatus Peregrinibacteria bacterium]|nr:hypothetical protein [Candidatus Peregrinibacteria bacterium]
MPTEAEMPIADTEIATPENAIHAPKPTDNALGTIVADTKTALAATIITPDQEKVLAYITKFCHGYPDAKYLPAIKKLKITFQEFEKKVAEILPMAYSGNIPLSNSVKWLLFIYAGGVENFTTLYDTQPNILEGHGRNGWITINRKTRELRDIIVDIERSKANPDNAAMKYFSEDISNDVSLLDITLLTPEEIQRCIKVSKIFPQWKIGPTIPKFIYDPHFKTKYERLKKRQEECAYFAVVSDSNDANQIINYDETEFKIFKDILQALIETRAKKAQQIPAATEITADLEKNTELAAWITKYIKNRLHRENIDDKSDIIIMVKIGHRTKDEKQFERIGMAVCRNLFNPDIFRYEAFMKKDELKGTPSEEEITTEFIKHSIYEQGAVGFRNDVTNEKYKHIITLIPEFDISGEIHEENALFLMFMYANISEEDMVSAETEEFRKYVKEKVKSSKKFLLTYLEKIRDGILKTKTQKTSTRTAIHAICNFGVSHCKMLETTIDFIHMLHQTDGFIYFFFKELEELFKKFAHRNRRIHEKSINYTNDEYASFYEKMLSVGNSDIRETLVNCFNTLDLNKENFHIMQEEIMNICAITSMIGNNHHQLERRIRTLKFALNKIKGAEAQRKALIAARNDLNTTLIKVFKNRFGLQNLPEINQETVKNIMPLLTYLRNIHKNNKSGEGENETDTKNERIIIFFILLKILNKWNDFRSGKTIDVDEYLSPDMKKTIQEYLEERKKNDTFRTHFSSMVDAEHSEAFFEQLTGKSEAKFEGKGPNISDILSNIELNYRDLGDPDNFHPRVLRIIQRFGAQEVRDKTIGWTIEQNEDTDELSRSIMELHNSKAASPSEISVYAAILAFVEYCKTLNIPAQLDSRQNTEKLRTLRIEISAQFKKLQEVLKQRPSFMYSLFRDALKSLAQVINAKEYGGPVHVRSTMTSDINDVANHIRQCLTCKTDGENNDTNLSFGDRNKLLIVTRLEGMQDEESISDQIVTVMGSELTQPHNRMSFVMDNVYGGRSKDVLIVNVLAIAEKIKELKKFNPKAIIEIFVTDDALSSCGIDMEELEKNLKNHITGATYQVDSRIVQVDSSASGNQYFENLRRITERIQSGNFQINGLVIRI